MAKSAEQNKLLFHEPNPKDNGIISNEDLSIFVELETTTKGRSIINLDGKNGEGKVFNRGGKTRGISFIDGSSVGEKNSLTTSYTQLNRFTNENGDSETLGIESVDISFDTAYTPMIKIKFIDVRGNSIFQGLGNTDNDYSFFFDLPYPIFSLTVKGYYGRPVKYCLHLLKWNAKFNSNTGNFEIDAEFIGYTYAILTDLLLGYLRAVVYTEEGSVIFDGIKQEYAAKGITVKTIDDFLKDIETIADEFEKLKNEDDEIKELNTSSTIRESIKILRNRLDNLINVLIPEGTDYFDDGGGVICVDPKKSKEDDVKISIDDYKTKIKKDLDNPETGLNTKINVEALKFRTKNITDFITIKTLKYDDFMKATSEITGTEKIFATNLYERDTENENSSVNKFVAQLSTTLNRNLPTGKKGNPGILVYDLRKAYNEIDRVEKALISNEKDVRLKVGEKLSKIASDKLDFEPTVRNIFRILTIHCEVLLETLRKVSTDAENSASREKVLKKLLGNLNIKEGDKKIYPWPEFKFADPKDGKKAVFEEKWIGGEDGVKSTSDKNKVDEIKFVEDLLEQLLKVAQKDIDSGIENGEKFGPQFFPVSTLDTRFTSNLTDNPYKEALINGTSTAIPDEATRCLLLRGFLGLGVSNRNLPDSSIEAMGELEAYNLVDIIKKDFTKSNGSNLLSDLNIGNSVSDKVNKIINKWKEGVDGLDDNPFNKKTPLLLEDGDDYLYSYITDNPTVKTDKTYTRAYLPISSNFGGSEFYIAEDDGIVLKDIPGISQLSNSMSFVGNNFSSSLNKLDNLEEVNDGSVYLKFISKDDYDEGLSSPTYGNEFFDVYRKVIPKGSLLNQSTLPKATYDDGVMSYLDPYSGRYKAPEIFDMIYDLDSSDKIKSGEGVIYVKENKTQENEGSILSSFWSQRDFDKEYQGGTYLAKGKEIIKEETVQFCNGCGPHRDGAKGRYNLNEDRFTPNSFGNQRELLGELLGEVKISDKDERIIYTPFIEYGIANHEDNTLNHFSLFGSKFYEKQTTMDAKGLLFLHSFGWQGLIGDIKDEMLKTDTTDVSLFDILDNDGDSFDSEDDTPTIKSIFKNNGAFVKAPKLWCVFIGGMLKRYHIGIKTGNDIINFGHIDGTFEQLFSWQDSSSYVPSYNQYLYDIRSQSPFGINFVFDNGDTFRDDDPSKQKYAKIDETLLNLPPQVKLEFIEKFDDFIENNFEDIDNELNVIVDGKTRQEIWTELNEAKFVDTNVVNTSILPTYIDSSFIKDMFDGTNVTKSYMNISPAVVNNSGVNLYQLNLQIKPNSDITEVLNNLITQSYVIQNGVPKIFNQTKDVSTSKYEEIRVNKEKYEKYLTSFYIRFEKLVEEFDKDVDNEQDDLEQKIFKTMNDDLIKLNIYRGLGSLYNKWIGGSDGNVLGQCGFSVKDSRINENEGGNGKSRLIDSFRFLDRAFNDIGDKLYINPIAILDLVRGNYNQTFFDLINRILTNNNFNFIALPSFLNFNKLSQLEEMFTPYSYNDSTKEDFEVGPSFVCTYVGQTSTNLDLGNNSNYPNDGIFIRFDENGQIYDAPEDFINDNDDPRDLNIPMISVNYGKQNQSFFKDIRLDQKEFTETAESLEIIEDISQSGDKRKPTSAGQNLINVYQTRSYSAEIEMMGNVMMQPMMYFQLNNVPMFRGAYMILKVSHQIKANSMTTKFKGVRIKRTRTKLIDSATLFMELLGSLKGLGNADAVTSTGDGVSNNTSTNSGKAVIVPNKVGDENNDITGIIIEG